MTKTKTALKILKDDGIISLMKEIKSFIWKKITLFTIYVKKKSNSGVSETNNLKIYTNSKINLSKFAKISDGALEEQERILIEKHLEKKDNVIELGAGIGYISCLTANLLSEESKHLVLEANNELIEIIEKNRKLNRQSFEIINKAYSATNEEIKLNISEGYESSSQFTKTNKKKNVEAIPLQDLSSKHNIENFTLISDIEGSEIGLIEEKSTLKEKCNLLIIELHPQKVGKKKIEELKQSFKTDFNLIDKKNQVHVFKNKEK